MNGSVNIGNRYEIVERIGRGMVGPVYRGVDLETGRSVAIKALSPEIAEKEPSLLQRFWLEGDALRQLNHPNIVHRLDEVETDGIQYLVMEYVEGGSLRDILDEQPQLPLEQVLEIGLDLADALTRTHRLGIIHRDLKPENVLIASDGTPRLSDFGVAHFLRRDTLPKEGGITGTWVYISPETFQGVEADERADIWSFGVLLFEMLSGRLPFDVGDPAVLINVLLSEPVPDLRELRPDLPVGLCELVHQMLQKDRRSRIPSVRLVGAALEAVYKGQEVNLPSPEAVSKGQAARMQLPEHHTSFVGRVRELGEVVAMFQDPHCRLVTLTGPGGVGKTRLALQAAGEMQADYEDGVFFVDLAPVVDPDLVPSRIARALGVKEGPTRALVEDLGDWLRARQTLLILDNFEQVVEAAPIISDLIAAAPGLDVLATSREGLQIYGEREYPVHPLSLPDLNRDESPSDLLAYESVALFLLRARARQPDFHLTQSNARAVAELCVRLDGIPLAIELAAARIKVFPIQFLLDQLAVSLDALAGGARDLSDRHRTLRGAIDWSYNLLDENEKKLFARLAVFKGGASLRAVVAVCNPGFDIDVMGELESLVNKNLLQGAAGDDGKPRFTFLETIHRYALEHLGAVDEVETFKKRHAEYFAELAEIAEPELKGSNQDEWSSVLKSEYDNLRAAMAWALAGADIESGLRLVGSLSEFWFYEGPLSDGEMWIERALGWRDQASPRNRARVLNGAGMLAFVRGDHPQGTAWNRAALQIGRDLQDKNLSAWALFWLSAQATGDPDQYREGLALCEDALDLFRELDDRSGLAWGYNQIGELSRLLGDYTRARGAYQESLEISHAAGNRRREAIALMNLGYVAQHQGDYRGAEEFSRRGLILLRELGLKYHSAIALSMLAGPTAVLGDPVRAATLLGASESVFESMSVSLQPADQVEIDRYVALVGEKIEFDAFERARARGRAMSYQEAITYALQDTSET